MSFKQIYVGFDGPSTPKAFVFTSAGAASASWLGAALASQVEPVLSQVDFNHQVLVVAAVGKRETTTGNVSISLVQAHQGVVMPYVRIGVNEPPCNEERRPSFPFVVAVIEKPQGLRSIAGYDNQNFPDGCKPVRSGTSHNEK